MIKFELLEPTEAPEQQIGHDNVFLYQAESKPLPPIAEVSDDDAQEIVVLSDVGEILRFLFNAKEDVLQDRVAGACNSIFVTSGEAGIRALEAGIRRSGWIVPGGRSPAIRVNEGALKATRGEPQYSDPTQTPKRAAIYAAVEQWRQTHQSFRDKALARIQIIAIDYADRRLVEQANLAWRQAVRYLGSSRPRSASIGNDLVSKDAPLTGADFEALVQGLVEIATLRRELEYFRGQVEQQKARLRGVGIADNPTGVMRPLKLLHAGAAQDLRGLLEDPEGVQALGAATQGVEAAARILSQRCAALCRLHPVLYRLWDRPIAFEVADTWNKTTTTVRLQALRACEPLRQELTQVFNATNAASVAFQSDLRINPQEIWRYDAAIYAAMEEAHLTEGDVAWRIAEDHLAETKEGLSTLAQVSLALGGIEMLAVTCGVAPPVAAVLAVAGTAGAIGELIESAINEARKDRAFEACLNPGDSLAAEQGSYAGTVMIAMFILSQLIHTPIRGAIRAVSR